MPVLLLCLFFHAFLLSATHCHRAEPVGPAGERAGVSVAAEGGPRRAAETGGHAQCLLCRLQRDFLTDFGKRYTPAEPSPQAVLASRLLPPHAFSTRPFSKPSGRAPPLA